MNFVQKILHFFVIQKFYDIFGCFLNRSSRVSVIELKQVMSVLHSRFVASCEKEGTSMLLNELDLDLDTFWEDEQAALAALPVDASGLAQLLEYLEEYDSPEGWRVLLDEFGEWLDARTLEEKRIRAAELFGDAWNV